MEFWPSWDSCAPCHPRPKWFLLNQKAVILPKNTCSGFLKMSGSQCIWNIRSTILGIGLKVPGVPMYLFYDWWGCTGNYCTRESFVVFEPLTEGSFTLFPGSQPGIVCVEGWKSCRVKSRREPEQGTLINNQRFPPMWMININHELLRTAYLGNRLSLPLNGFRISSGAARK